MKKEEIVMGLYAMRLKGKNRVAQERNNTVDRAVELINQMDEPEQTDIGVGLSKPVVPQFAADYIEQSKKDNDSINQVFAFMDDKEDKDLWHWLFPSTYEEQRANQEVFMRAWLDGYEVEKEKRYYIVEKINNSTLMAFELSDVVGEEIIEFVDGYSENETIHFNSKEKAELIAHFVGESLEVEEVTE